MSRTGVEARLPWKRVPQAVRQQIEAALGAPVKRASRIWGGYAPTPTYRLALADGRQAFFKGPYAILHGDLHSDNLRFTHKQLYLFDWPAITVGRPEWDIVAFAQSVTVEGGPSPEQVMEWYREHFSLNSDAVECALAWWLTFFADRAWRPEIPGLPRVRRFQRQQLGILACWAARQWSLPSPEWAGQLLA